MTPTQFAQLTLGLYAALFVVLIAWQMFRTPGGAAVWWLYFIERIYVGLMFRWRANSRCPFPATGGMLIIANHRSPVDPLFLWMNHHLTTRGNVAPRPLGFMVAREYTEIPGLRWICRATGAIPVSRNGRDMAPARMTLDRLNEGWAIGIFPEGGINDKGGLLRANSGIAWLALRADVPIFPVFIHEAPQRENMVKPFCTPQRVRVTYGEPVDLSAYAGRRKSQETLREVTTLLMTRLGELGGVEYDPDRPRLRRHQIRRAQ